MNYDIIIIGSGPAGYVAAIRAGQLGMKTALIEKDKLGGMCLNWGCIPSKALMESAKLYQRIQKAADFGITGIDKNAVGFDFAKAMKRASRFTTKLGKGIEFLQKKHNVDVIQGEATIRSENAVSVDGRRLECKHLIIATGSRPELPVQHEKIMEIPEFFQQKTLPEKIAVYGCGPHTVELAQILAMAGHKVGLYVPADGLLASLDKNLQLFIMVRLKKDKVKIHFNTIFSVKDGELYAGESPVSENLIINGANRKAVLPASDIHLNSEDGFLQTDENFQVQPKVYAIGDVNGRYHLAHAASAQAMHVVNRINGIQADFPFERVPLNMYTSPEIAVIGKSEAELQAAGAEFRTGDFSFSANGKAMVEGTAEGFMRIFSEPEFGEVLGVQIASPNATDLISEAAVLMELEGTVFEFGKIIHAHPTISEVFVESAADTMGEAIHK